MGDSDDDLPLGPGGPTGSAMPYVPRAGGSTEGIPPLGISGAPALTDALPEGPALLPGDIPPPPGADGLVEDRYDRRLRERTGEVENE